MSKTQRPDNNGGTLRPGPNNGGTLRPDANQGGAAPKGGTMRPDTNQGAAPKGGTMRPDANQGGVAPKGGTMRPDTNQGAAPKSGTMRPGALPKSGNAAAGQKPKTQDVEIKVLNDDADSTSLNEITLNGVTYTVDGLISASTGEAQIYKLSKSGKIYALKLYYSGMSPNPEVVDTLKKASGTGFLVDIIDQGTWKSPQGESRDFELMPFYTGGELKSGSLAGQADRLKATAAAMIMALKVSHDHNILHKDIKPENYFYVDSGHTQLVLADFGIASVFKRDSKGKMLPLKTRLQWRTKIYAAPEIYTAIDGEIEYADEKSDYYSLGMALLTLWIGEKPFEGIDERMMIRLKRGESGQLPYPKDMPEQLLHLIKGLTVPNPDKRWGFAEFERWARGEDVPVEGENNRLSADKLNILYNGSKDQVATSFEELAKLMIADRRLAENYLYSGKISEWMQQANYPEMKAQIDEITKKLYPKPSEAGVYAACYLFDPDLPYYAPTGKELFTQEEIAHDMARNASKYLEQLKDPNALLYIYFRAAGIDLASQYQPLAMQRDIVALWRLIFALYPDEGFPLYVPSNNAYIRCSTVEELVDEFSKLPANVYTNRMYAQGSNNYVGLLYDEAFISWVAHRDAALAGKLKSKLMAENNKKNQLYYYIFYLLAPERNYLCKPDQSEVYTIEQLADKLNDDLIKYYIVGRHENDYSKYQENLDNVNMLVDCKDNRLYYYLKSKELYQQKFDYISYCFDMMTRNGNDKLGPYDIYIAIFKTIKALSRQSKYYFPKSDKYVTDMNGLKSIPKAEKLDEMKNGLLKSWMAVQFQEDPYAKISNSDEYAELLLQYTEALGDIDPDLTEASRMNDAVSKLRRNARRIKSMIAQVWIWRAVWFLIIAVPLLAMAWSFYKNGVVPRDPSMSGIWFLVAAWVVPLRLIQSLPFVSIKAYEIFGDNFISGLIISHRWINSLIFAIVIVFGWHYMEKFGGDYGRWFMPALCLLVLFWRWWRTVRICSTYAHQKGYQNTYRPDRQAIVIDPLFYAWKDKTNDFDSETVDLQEEYLPGLRGCRYYTIVNTLHSLIPLAIMIFVWLQFSPVSDEFVNKHFPAAIEWIKSKAKSSGADSKPAYNYQVTNVSSFLSVREQPSTSAKVLGQLKNKDGVEVVDYDADPKFAKIKYGKDFAYVSKDYIKEYVPESEPVASPAKSEKSKSADKSKKQEKAETSATEANTSVEQSESNAPAQTAAPAANAYRVRNGANLPVYSEQSDLDEYIVGQFGPDDVIDVLGTYSSGFSKVKFNGGTGYVETRYIEKI